MMQHRDERLARARALTLSLSILATSFACGDDDALKLDASSDRDASGGESDAAQDEHDAESVEPDAGDGMRSVAIQFKAKIGSRDLVCGEHYTGLGATGVTATPQDFRFYVQDVRLLRKDGEEVPLEFDVKPPFQRAEVALIDFTDGVGACAASGGRVVNTTITGKVPAGDYDGVVFVNGVPEELNHSGPAETMSPPLDDVTMFWSWLSGYRFIVAELLPVAMHGAAASDAGAHGDSAVQGDAAVHGDGGAHGDAGMHGEGGMASSGHGASEAAFLHIGSSACTGGQASGFSCARQARNEIKLTGFDPGTNVVVADLAEVFKEADLKSPPQCHGVAAVCAAGYAALGIDMNSGEKASTQRVFRVE